MCRQTKPSGGALYSCCCCCSPAVIVRYTHCLSQTCSSRRSLPHIFPESWAFLCLAEEGRKGLGKQKRVQPWGWDNATDSRRWRGVVWWAHPCLCWMRHYSPSFVLQSLIEDARRWARCSESVALGFAGQVRRLRGTKSWLSCVRPSFSCLFSRLLKNYPWQKENDGLVPSRSENLKCEVENKQIYGPNIQG